MGIVHVDETYKYVYTMASSYEVELFTMNYQALPVEPANRSQELFHKINNFTCFAGLLNLWSDDLRVPRIISKPYYKLFFKFITFCVFVLMVLEISAFLKRDKLSMKQLYDFVVLAMTHPILYGFFLSVHYYKAKLRDLLVCLTVQLKNVYNNPKVERSMIRRATFYVTAYLSLCGVTMALYGIDSLIQVISLGKTFTTVVTVWPDVEDKTTIATVARTAYYIIWWFLISRSSTAYIMAIATTICLSHQFKNLQTYFYGLDDIFTDEGLTQEQKEEKYEKALKVGIKLHSDTLWCCRQCQIVFNLVYSGQVIINVMGLVVLMLQMVNSERTILNAVAIVTTASALLVTTGVFMWNAGDVAVEASNLATAMYSSGWQHCGRAAGPRVRQLLLIAMTQAQKPVIIRGYGIIELSYRSYLTIVKSSYSVFSILY